jgi:hypothetical protein
VVKVDYKKNKLSDLLKLRVSICFWLEAHLPKLAALAGQIEKKIQLPDLQKYFTSFKICLIVSNG